MKKQICAILCALLVLSAFSACNADNGDPDGSSTPSSSEQGSSSSRAEEFSSSSEAGSEESSSETSSSESSSSKASYHYSGTTYSPQTSASSEAESPSSSSSSSQTIITTSKQGKVTQEEYDRIQEGMTYEEVVGIVGGEGRMLVDSDLGFGEEYRTAAYKWRVKGSMMESVVCIFDGEGKLTQKMWLDMDFDSNQDE